jgi:hypothetical protein
MDLNKKILEILGLDDKSSDEEIVHNIEKIFDFNLINLKKDEKKIKKEDLTVESLLLKFPQLLQIELIEEDSTLREKMQKRLMDWYRTDPAPTFTDLSGKVIKYKDLSDKNLGDEIAKSWGMPLPQKYGAYKFKDLPWDNIPNNVMIKHTIEHCMTAFVDNKIYKAGTSDTWELVNNLSLKEYKEDLVKSDKFGKIYKNKNNKSPDYETYGEWIIEEFIQDYDSNFFIPRDFKCLCINGKVWYILVIDRNNKLTGVGNGDNSDDKYYTRDFIPLRSYYNNKNNFEPLEIKKPEKLAELIKYAELASANCKNLMRFDFYITQNGIKFGEFTTYPKGGNQQYEAKNFYNQLMELYE